MPELSYDQLVEMRTNRLAQLYNDGTGDAWLMTIDTALSVGKERDAAVATSRELLIEVDRWGQEAHEAGGERDRAIIELRALRDRIRAVLRDYPTSAVPAVCVEKALEP